MLNSSTHVDSTATRAHLLQFSIYLRCDLSNGLHRKLVPEVREGECTDSREVSGNGVYAIQRRVHSIRQTEALVRRTKARRMPQRLVTMRSRHADRMCRLSVAIALCVALSYP